MSDQRCDLRYLLPVLLLSGCEPSLDKYFSSLADAWADQTLDAAGPSITAALVIAGLTDELCRSDIDWDGVEEGEHPPFSSVMLQAMGFPEIDIVSIEDNLTEIYLREVRIMDREEASLRIVPDSSESTFTLTAEIKDGRDGETFGSLTFTVDSDCSESSRPVTGNAKWSDLSGIEHIITIPADDTDVGLKFDCAYIPHDGTLFWSGTVSGQVRRFTSADAAEIVWRYQGSDTTTPTDTGTASPKDCDGISDVVAIDWSGTVVGGSDDWNATTVLDILSHDQ